MTMTNRHNRKSDCFIFMTIEEMVPQNHLVRKLEKGIDFRFIYPKVEHLYSKVGKPSIDPVVLFKLLILNIVDGNNSMRKTCERAQTDMAYRWFLGYDAFDSIPNYSTWSQNYIRRYKDSNIFNEIFDEILSQAIRRRFVDLTTVFCDGTHQKANANTRKNHKETVELVSKYYEDDLLREINEEREYIGAKPIESLTKTETIFDEETGEAKEVIQSKEITVSDTDPECGLFHKGEKLKCFAYSHMTFCDRKGFVLNVKTVPGNEHDSVSFIDAYNQLNKKFPQKIENIVGDSAFKTAPICRTVIENDQRLFSSYTRQRGRKGYLKKYEFVYDEVYDIYICPNNKTLSYTTTSKDGCRNYQSDPKDCKNCPFKERCTKNKHKIIKRHLWEKYIEMVEDLRHTEEWKTIYELRKQSIERVFADCKERFGMRFTRLIGLKKNQDQALMIFACHNLKRMALWSC